MLEFTDNLNILESSLNHTKRAAQDLDPAANKIGLKINTKKTMIMKLLENKEDTDDKDENVVFK